LTNATGLPISTGVSGLGTGIATALAVNTGSAGAPVLFNGALGTPSSGTVTNLTGTASININGTVGATTATTGAFTTLTTSSTVTHNGGTANGVAYLNGSKVLTSGSALTFNGTDPSTTGVWRSSKADAGFYGYQADGSTLTGFLQFNQFTGVNLVSQNANPIIFTINSTEGMRLTSTGLGIGTSSVGSKLDVFGAQVDAAGSGNIRSIDNSTLGANKGGGILFGGNYTGTTPTVWAVVAGLKNNATDGDFGGYLSFRTRLNGGTTSENMRLDSAGNLGVGAAPSAWAALKAVQIGSGSFAATLSGQNTVLTGNAIYDGAWKYVYNGFAGYYQLNNGNHQWFNGASGTAGNAITFTQAMTLDASNNLFLGGTTSSYTAANRTVLAINGTTSSFLSLQSGGTDRFYVIASATQSDLGTLTSTPLTFNTNATERARINTDGNLLVGTTSGNARVRVVATSSQSGGIYVTHVNSGNDVISCENSATTGNNVFIAFYTDATVQRGSITYNRAGGLVVYGTTSDYRAKDIIGPVTDTGALIDSVPVYMGKMKGATQERPMFIAHETPTYAHMGEKDAVDADGNPVYQQMDASTLIPVMWAEIQSLRQRLSAANL
jgi:hypothetical protein